ncbi:hypothetical protein HPB50_013370 [Hyalomma asiaticum]|uniref:Uncharacterized protein n=1 Tax=Hyalomma asiaticum TaxID=266040 RepID=A0ACB7SQ68_HYAAI|nr:hypothetical protein HPB50_013370 [Hyalomma asiaticum]
MLRGKTARLRTSPPSTSTSPVRIGVVDGRSPAQRALGKGSQPPSPPPLPSVTNLSPMPVTQSSSCGTTFFFFFGCAGSISAGSNASSGTGFFLFSSHAPRGCIHLSGRQQEKSIAPPLLLLKAASGAHGPAEPVSYSAGPVGFAGAVGFGGPPSRYAVGPPHVVRPDRTKKPSPRRGRPRQIASLSLPLARARTHSDMLLARPEGLLPGEDARFWSAVGTDGRWNQRTSQSPGHSHTRTREPVERLPFPFCSRDALLFPATFDAMGEISKSAIACKTLFCFILILPSCNSQRRQDF